MAPEEAAAPSEASPPPPPTSAKESCRCRDARFSVFFRDEGEGDFFDAFVCFNVIYHGTADEVRRHVQLLESKLRPGGHGFVTLLSRRNRMYGRGEALDPHTFISPGMFQPLFEGEGEKGVPHHFSGGEEACDFFTEGFHIETLHHQELEIPFPGETPESTHWQRIPRGYFWRFVLRKREFSLAGPPT